MTRPEPMARKAPSLAIRPAAKKRKAVQVARITLINPVSIVALQTAQRCGHALSVTFDGGKLTLYAEIDG